MLTISRILLIIAGVLLILDAIAMFAGIPNPLGYSIPCPITLLILGVGILIFSIANVKKG